MVFMGAVGAAGYPHHELTGTMAVSREGCAMGKGDLLEVLYLAPEGDRDPSPTRRYRFDRRDTGDRGARQRRRAWLLVGLFAAAAMTALALGPQVPPLGTPQVAANAGHGTVEPMNQPAIYRPCTMMAWMNLFGGCGLRLDDSN